MRCEAEQLGQVCEEPGVVQASGTGIHVEFRVETQQHGSVGLLTIHSNYADLSTLPRRDYPGLTTDLGLPSPITWWGFPRMALPHLPVSILLMCHGRGISKDITISKRTICKHTE
jgi:hypothetical protein